MRSSVWLTTLGFGVASVLACGGGDGGGGGGNNGVLSMAQAPAPSGDGQTGVVGQDLPQKLRVQVMEDGKPKSGIFVQWHAADGMLPVSSQTDANGIAVATWKLDTVAGPQAATVTLANATGSPVGYSATATTGVPGVTVLSGDKQGKEVGQNFDAPLRVKVEDQYHNPVATTVTWTPTGAVGVSSTSTLTNGQGEAQVTANAVSGGTGTVTAFAPGASSSGIFSLAAGHRLVTTGATFYSSLRNGTSGPAVDTVQVGQTILWVNGTGNHTVSLASPGTPYSGFPLTIFTVTFGAGDAGMTYQYECTVHGPTMNGTIVVQ